MPKTPYDDFVNELIPDPADDDETKMKVIKHNFARRFDELARAKPKVFHGELPDDGVWYEFRIAPGQSLFVLITPYNPAQLDFGPVGE